MASRRLAGKVARRKARATFRSAMRMPKRKLAKIYATKVGQVTYTSVKKRRFRKRRGRRRRRRRY